MFFYWLAVEHIVRRWKQMVASPLMLKLKRWKMKRTFVSVFVECKIKINLFPCLVPIGRPVGPGAEPTHQGPVPGPGGSVRCHGCAAGICGSVVPQPFPFRCAFLLHHTNQVLCLYVAGNEVILTNLPPVIITNRISPKNVFPFK